MKSPMLKAELIIRSDQKKSLTEALQQIGLVHLEELGELQNINNDARWKEWLDLEAWLKELPELDENIIASPLKGKLIPQLQKFRRDWSQWLHQQEELEQSSAFWEIWVGFNPEKWRTLSENGLHIALFLGDEKDFETLSHLAHKQKATDQGLYFYCIGTWAAINEIALEHLALPPLAQSEIQTARSAQAEEKLRLQQLQNAFLEQMDSLEAEAAGIREDWEFEQGLALWKDLGETPLLSIKAWLAAQNESDFRAACTQYPIAYRLSAPSKDDQVPVDLKNDGFSKLFEPITKIFQLPHYFEFDLTPLIAVFYPLLFAYCLGDAGYGAIMTLSVIIGWFSFLKKQKALAALVGILGISTTIIGLIKSGSLFGVPLSVDSDIAWLASLANLVIIPDDSAYFFNAFNVALLIGVLQILIGIFLAIAKAWYYDGFKASLSQWGKLLIAVSAVALFMSETLKLRPSDESFLYGSLVLGMLLIMLFHDLSQSLLVRIGSSVLPLFFIFTGLLGDVLSYVRLFALGVTSAVLGLVVNQIGMDMVTENWWSWIGAIAFLIFGHGLNFVLAALGSFIHPLRLTFVEFYNNAQFEGGGKAFQAFKKTEPLN